MGKIIRLIKKLPYNRIRAWKEAIKMGIGERPWPEHAPSIHVDKTPQDLEAELRGAHYEGLYLSYDYQGQVLELRRPEGVDADYKQLEVHPRARNHPDKNGLELIAHIERSRYEHKSDHINEEGFRWLTEDELEVIAEGESLGITGEVVQGGWSYAN